MLRGGNPATLELVPSGRARADRLTASPVLHTILAVGRLGRVIFGVLLMGLALSFALSELLGWVRSGPPVEDGTVLLYQVDEEEGEETQRYGVKIRFRARDDGTFRADIMAPHGVRGLNVNERLEPTVERDNAPLEFPTREGRPVEPGLLWLPPDRRVPGMNTLAGLVDGVVGRGRFEVWEVRQETGSVFFDVETGILVGFEVDVGKAKVKARLQGIY
jgi:hypothetical protein